MQLHTIETGYFKLDGGAMFGVVPKKIWHKLVPADENNLCTWAMRSLLIESGNRKILIDCGMGNKQDEKFFSHYEPSGTPLMQSLAQKGFQSGDITDVFLTHLHFDHCGGAVERDNSGNLLPAFPNATYWSNEAHWAWASNPNSREKASFLKENFIPLTEHGVVKFLKPDEALTDEITCIWVNGHTAAMMLPVIRANEKTLIYMADLIPAAAHVPIPYVMGYDVQPLLTIEEKASILNHAVKHDYNLFFEHDAINECCNLQLTEKGVRVKDVFALKSL